jgi:hypothetical protein
MSSGSTLTANTFTALQQFNCTGNTTLGKVNLNSTLNFNGTSDTNTITSLNNESVTMECPLTVSNVLTCENGAVVNGNLTVTGTVTVNGQGTGTGGTETTTTNEYFNLGVGTTAPTKGLDVVGGAVFDKIAVTGFADMSCCGISANCLNVGPGSSIPYTPGEQPPYIVDVVGGAAFDFINVTGGANVDGYLTSTKDLVVNRDTYLYGSTYLRGGATGNKLYLPETGGIRFTNSNGTETIQMIGKRFAENVVLGPMNNPIAFDYFHKNNLWGTFQVTIEPYAYTGAVDANLYASSPSSYPSITPFTTNSGEGMTCTFTLLSTQWATTVSNINTICFSQSDSDNPPYPAYVEQCTTINSGTSYLNLLSLEGIAVGNYVAIGPGSCTSAPSSSPLGNILMIDRAAHNVMLSNTIAIDTSNNSYPGTHVRFYTNICKASSYTTTGTGLTVNDSNISYSTGDKIHIDSGLKTATQRGIDKIVKGMLVTGDGIPSGTVVTNASVSNGIYTVTTNNSTTSNGSYTSGVTFCAPVTSPITPSTTSVAGTICPVFQVGPSCSSNVTYSVNSSNQFYMDYLKYFTVGSANSANFTYNMSYLRLS